MALREIRKKGDPCLRRKCRSVDKINGHILSLLDDMAETMYKAPGVGLAAPQVGVCRRIAVVDIGEGLHELINPEIIRQEGEQIGLEGCLSIPGESGYVVRPQAVCVRALNRSGDVIEIEAEGYLAVAICHEIDHLDGILYTDKTVELTPEEIEALELANAQDEQEERNVS